MPRLGMRKIPAPDFTEGRREEKQVQKRNVVAMYLLRIGYDWNVSGGTGVGSILSDAAYRILRTVTVQTGGRPLHSVRGHTLGKIVKLFFPQEYASTDPTSLAAGATETGRETEIPIPFFMPWSVNPSEFGLPTPVADARVIIDGAEADELATGEDGDPSFTNVETELNERPYEGVPAQPYAKWGAMGVRHVTRAVNQDGTLSIDLDHLNRGQELRAVIVEGFSGKSASEEFQYDDAVVEEIGPLDIDGAEEFEAVRASTLQNVNKVDYELASKETGVYVLDAAPNGRTMRGELWRVRGAEKPFLDLKVTKQSGDCQVVVTTIAVSRGKRQSGGR